MQWVLNTPLFTLSTGIQGSGYRLLHGVRYPLTPAVRNLCMTRDHACLWYNHRTPNKLLFYDGVLWYKHGAYVLV